MEGTIMKFENTDCFAVQWDGFEKKWVDMWRCMLVETADKKFRWTELTPEPDYHAGGGRSGGDWENAAEFEGAQVPTHCDAFSLMTKIRTTHKGKIQHLVAWGAADGSRRSIDFRLRENGNLEYGEHTGAISSGWRTVIATPYLNLADGKWHSVGITRWKMKIKKEADSGNVSLWCDGELVGQGVITAAGGVGDAGVST